MIDRLLIVGILIVDSLLIFYKCFFFGGGTSIFGTHLITLPENIPEGFRCPSLVLGCF